jgi:Mrp family chromosome partitioning ATPase
MSLEDWDGDTHTIAITSALEGEGVTSVARSLAAILANDLERSVCLVETNWWSGSEPMVVEGLDIGRPGLADVIKGSASIEEALMHTSDPRLVVLASGELPIGRRPAAISGGGFRDVLDAVAKDFDSVVIDTPPVLMTSEATAIAREASGTILVVHRGVTTEEQVETAIDELDGAELLGVIVNRARPTVPKLFRRLGLPV